MKDQLNLKDVNTERRIVIKKIIKFLPLVGVGAFTYPLVKFASFEEIQKISLVISLKEIDNKIIKKGKVLIHKSEEGITVYDAHCTHMGCILNYDEKKDRFVCPCHNSEFTISGKRLQGPAQRDLDIISSKIENKLLYIG